MAISTGAGLAIAGGLGLAGSLLGRNASQDANQSATQAIADSRAESDRIIAAANQEAASQIAAGNEAAAQATIESAKIAADALLKSQKMAIALRREFARKANKVLQPTIRQGRFSTQQMASMLGIPNDKGEIVPFSIESGSVLDNRLTAAAQAIDRSAVGKKLSSQTEFTQALAGLQAFDDEVKNLQFLSQLGANAENQLAAGYFGTGAGLAQTAQQTGQGLANISLNQGNTLADIFTSGAAQQAQLGMNAANQLSQNALGMGQAFAQSAANRGAIQSNFFNQLGQLGQLPLLSSFLEA